MENHLKGSFIIPLILEDLDYRAYICICNFQKYMENFNNIEEFLHTKERDYFNGLKFEKKIKDYLIGRYSAKMAISAYTNESDLRSIYIYNGIFNQPVISLDNSQDHPQISITHSKDIGAAISFSEGCPMGLDIEFIREDNLKALKRYIADGEIHMIEKLQFNYVEALYMLWTLKESLSKTIRTAFFSPVGIYEIGEIVCMDGYIVSSYKNFPMFLSICFILGGYMLTITYPRKAKIKIDIPKIKCEFENL